MLGVLGLGRSGLDILLYILLIPPVLCFRFFGSMIESKRNDCIGARQPRARLHFSLHSSLLSPRLPLDHGAR